MVKGRGSASSASERACPPLASLSLASTHLKPSIRSSPLFAHLLKRPPFLHTNEPSMNAPPVTSTIHDLEACPNSHSLELAELSAESNAAALAANKASMETPSPPVEDDDDVPAELDKQVSMCGRQRLQQHRIQMSGKVIIPDTWGREQQLQEWVSYGIVEDALRPAGLMSARTALVSEFQSRGSKPVRTSADVEVS